MTFVAKQGDKLFVFLMGATGKKRFGGKTLKNQPEKIGG